MRHQNYNQARLISGREFIALGLDQSVKGAPENPAEAPPADLAPLISSNVITGLVRVTEALLIIAVAVATWVFYINDFSPQSLSRYLPVVVVAGCAMPLILQAGNLYTVHALIRTVDQVTRICLAWILMFGAIFAFVVFTQAGESFSRPWLASWFLGGLGSLMLYRIAVSFIVRRWNANGQLDRRAVLVGGGTPAANLIAALDNSSDSDVSIAGIFDDRTDDRSPDLVAGYRKLGTISELLEFARRTRVDLLIVTLPLTAESRLLELLKRLWVLPVDIRLSAYTQKLSSCRP
jgi:FlaA1/EpsC-like NDP-sugar epimerase